jgi:hypothetical protein
MCTESSDEDELEVDCGSEDGGDSHCCCSSGCRACDGNVWPSVDGDPGGVSGSDDSGDDPSVGEDSVGKVLFTRALWATGESA